MINKDAIFCTKRAGFRQTKDFQGKSVLRRGSDLEGRRRGYFDKSHRFSQTNFFVQRRRRRKSPGGAGVERAPLELTHLPHLPGGRPWEELGREPTIVEGANKCSRLSKTKRF